MIRNYMFFLWFTTLLATNIKAEESKFHQTRLIEANRMEANYNASDQLVNSSDLNQYLSKLVDRIASSEETAKGFFRIRSLRNPVPYIYCLDNGAIYISTGLMARLQNESQLAGILAPEMSSIYRQDSDIKNELTERRNDKENQPIRMIPKVLAFAFTMGIAAIPMASAQKKETDALNSKLQMETDDLAMQWLVNASFDITQSPTGISRLIKTLKEEQRFGDSSLSNLATLEIREQQLLSATTKLSNREVKALDEQYFKTIIRRFALELAYYDKSDVNGERFNTVILRIENESGRDGETVFLRGQYAREHSVNDSQLSESTKLYEEAIKLKNPPAEAWRELGMLYRRFENKDAALKNLTQYLQKKPNAPDAPIIKIYIDSL